MRAQNRNMTRWLRTLAFVTALCGCIWPAAAETLADPAAWQRDLEAWRAARAHQVSAPDGWLSLAGVAWLKPGLNALGSDAKAQLKLPPTAPARVGLITVSGNTVQLLSPAGGFPAGLTLNDQPAREIVLSTSEAAPSVLQLGSLKMLLIERAGHIVFQVKDSASPALTAFRGLNWYAPNPKLVVLAQWKPTPAGKMAELPTANGQSLKLPTPGVASFTLGEEPVELEPVLEDPASHSMLFLLRDTTSTSTTYPGGRLLRTQLPDNGLDKPGTVVLDFNRLENPSCAYTPYAACPLPQEKNRLNLAIEAGEKRYSN